MRQASEPGASAPWKCFAWSASIMPRSAARKSFPEESSSAWRWRARSAHDPAILLLDEPLSAVDVATRSRLLDEIVELQRQTRIPFLYVTHSPADAVRIGDSLLVLSEGRIVQQGKPLEVFNAPLNVPAAQVVGAENILLGTIAEHQPEQGISVVDLGKCRIIIPSAPIFPWAPA